MSCAETTARVDPAERQMVTLGELFAAYLRIVNGRGADDPAAEAAWRQAEDALQDLEAAEALEDAWTLTPAGRAYLRTLAGGEGAMSQRAYTIAQGRGEWVIFDHEGRRITGFPALRSAVRCVVLLLDGRFD